MAEELKFTLTVTGRSDSEEVGINMNFEPEINFKEKNYDDTGVANIVATVMNALQADHGCFDGE